MNRYDLCGAVGLFLAFAGFIGGTEQYLAVQADVLSGLHQQGADPAALASQVRHAQVFLRLGVFVGGIGAAMMIVALRGYLHAILEARQSTSPAGHQSAVEQGREPQ